MTRSLIVLSLTALLLAAIGCAKDRTTGVLAVSPPKPDYSRPLPPDRSALRLVTDPDRLPDLAEAYRTGDATLRRAVDRSLTWFAAPSSQRSFPFEGITHERARTSLVALSDLLDRAPDEQAFVSEFTRLFDVYESVGYDDDGVVLFTGYFSPVFEASRTRTPRFTHPLYRRPADLVTDPHTGAPLGRRTADGGVEPYATRAEIESSGMLRGTELVWLEDALSAYLIHVNGSAKLRLPNREIMYIGYAGKTDQPYASLGEAVIEAGMSDRDGMSLAALRRLYKEEPRRIETLMAKNRNFVFFTEYAGDLWPAGSLGVKVTPESSLATDKRIYPRGGLVLVDTEAITFSRGAQRFRRFMLDQDTGGAIQAPGRADIFMGVGPAAEILAGGQYAEGRLYYFFLKEQHVQAYAGARVALYESP